jgi:CRP-like cAMP-binding protein
MDNAIAQEIDNFFKQFKKQTFRKGEIMIRADDDPSGIFYITEGIVKKYAISHKGEELIVNLFKPHAFFPMSWAMNRTPNTFFYEAMTDVIVWKAPSDEAVKFVKSNPDILYDLMQRVYRGTDGMLMRMVYLMSGSAYTRLITELLILAKRFGIQDEKTGILVFRISEKDLGSQAGMTRETVSREMKRLKEQGFLEFDHGTIKIADLKKLELQLSEEN